MCAKSQTECQDPETIKAGFVIERDIQGIKDLALSLMDPETGEVVRRKGDYSTRQGVCAEPLTDTDLTKSIPVQGCLFFPKTEFFIKHYFKVLSFL